MKKYVSGFLFFFCLTAGALLGLFYMAKTVEDEDIRQVQAVETLDHPAFAESESEEVPVHVVLNQEQVIAKTVRSSYCLVAEEGYLIVYNKKEEAVDLFTHMPLSEFPVTEQEKLLVGIWFPTMAEIFSYLESYSS